MTYLSLPTLRRSALALALLAPLSFAGCDSSGGAKAMAPLEIDASTTCELDGMLLADYPGPKGQVFYSGQDKPQFFCDTVELLHTLLLPEQVKALAAAYVQDMGKADWDKPQGQWIDAKTALYVFGGKRHGSMGPTIASFALEADAQAFAKQWGGKVVRFADIQPTMVDLSGGALHDSKM
ncbi:nitrous oxide reductase accessory protein NosL [Curvibacter sp. APW13]|uniref:nitrous oxide reductase accessory protein NosL n=1 Tax=Curvibacter sp. APW13 TaxID=3077236 RepID=UPI0028DFA8D6|nr:nitrous oxide reductase accessory protein NosL [Curvibacter sp. APW13]MDT8990745.1 nitrous oxide reductase accessory protein NosL [Curvibacter sp. APW13]